MPQDSVYITILREPGKLFESTFDYFYPYVGKFHEVPRHGENSIEKWLDNATKYFNNSSYGHHDHFVKNSVTFDLGFNIKDDSEAYVKASIAKMNQMFDLVMIADHFQESMVLLAKLWFGRSFLFESEHEK